MALRIAFFAALLLVLSPLALEVASAVPTSECSDLVPTDSSLYCGGQWVCVSALGVSRCVRDVCWNTTTCY